MGDEVKQPVAIRVSRPYASEEEFLDHELETISRTSVVLVGAQARPQGVILRFEVALSNGTPLIRGEGRVVAFKEKAVGQLAGLTLRFTRLDTRSKALVDRVAALREARARAALDASMSDSVRPSSPPPAPSSRAAAPASIAVPPPAALPAPVSVPVRVPVVPASVAAAPAPPPPPPAPVPRSPAREPPSPRAPQPPTDAPQTTLREAARALTRRTELLDRLRTRADALGGPSLAAIFEAGRRHRQP